MNKIAPILFELSEKKHVTVAQVKSGEVTVQFRRWLYDDLAVCWDKIWVDVENFSLENESDIVSWKLEKNGIFC